MSILSIFRKIDRNRWFVCHNCMMHTDHDALNSVFYSDTAKVNVLGRPTMICPRCNDANTRSFQELKDEGAESALWGLEQLARKHPRSSFIVNSASHTTSVN
jgi:ribosomal protein L44E